MSTNGANGNGTEAAPIDPQLWTKTQMALLMREIEGRFPGCHVTLFLGDPGRPDQFSYATSAPPLKMRAMLAAFLSGGQ